MSDRDAFARAICADPDDDTPRLAFADFLDENGEGLRAEFIRTQVELARHPVEVAWADDERNRDAEAAIRGGAWFDWLGEPADDARRALLLRVCDLRRREAELFDAGTDPGGWMERPAWQEYTQWVRGFPRLVRMRPGDWLAYCDYVLRDPVRRVVWTTPLIDPADLATLCSRATAAGAGTVGRLLTNIAADVWRGVAFEIATAVGSRTARGS